MAKAKRQERSIKRLERDAKRQEKRNNNSNFIESLNINNSHGITATPKNASSDFNLHFQTVAQNVTATKSVISFLEGIMKKRGDMSDELINQFEDLMNSVVVKNFAIKSDMTKVPMKVITAGGVGKLGGHQLSVDKGNNRIRFIVVQDGLDVFIARGWVKKSDKSDYIRECKEAKKTIQAYKSSGHSVPLLDVLKGWFPDKFSPNPHSHKSEFEQSKYKSTKNKVGY